MSGVRGAALSHRGVTGGRSPRPEPSTGLPSYELTLCDATETPSVRARALLRGLSQAAACGPGQPTAHERSGSSARRPQPPSFAPAASASVWPPPRVPTSLCWALGVPRPLPEDRPGDDWEDGGAAPPRPCAGVRSRARSHHLLCGSPVAAQGTGGAGVRTEQPSPRGCVGPCDGVSPLSLLCVPSGGKGTPDSPRPRGPLQGKTPPSPFAREAGSPPLDWALLFLPSLREKGG